MSEQNKTPMNGNDVEKRRRDDKGGKEEERGLSITVEFTGGLEMLFSNQQSHKIRIPASSLSSSSTSIISENDDDGGNNTKTKLGNLPAQKTKTKKTTMKELIPWLCTNLMRDPRREMFVLDGGIRPGILVLINDADWELEGEENYELCEGDCVLFVSTLHGG